MAKQAINIIDLDVKKLITLLNKAFADEWLAYYQYWIGAKIAQGPMRPSVIAELEQHALDELRHALMLSNRIIQIGGAPITTPQEWFKMGNCKYAEPKDPSVKILLKQNIEGEQCAIATYNEMIKIVYEKDFVTYNMLTQILTDEIEHEEDLDNLLTDLKNLK